MVNYNNGKIYKIVSNTKDDICYVGSTTKQYLSQRMDVHRNEFKKWQKNNNQRKTTLIELFEKYGVENCKIILIENFPCNSKDELEKKEGEYVKTLNCINKRGMIQKVKSPRQEIEESDDISVLSDSSVSETKSEIKPTCSGVSNVPDPMRVPSDEYLINLRNEYKKYEYLYPALDKKIKWEEANCNVNMEFHLRKHTRKFTYILFKINLLRCNDLSEITPLDVSL